MIAVRKYGLNFGKGGPRTRKMKYPPVEPEGRFTTVQTRRQQILDGLAWWHRNTSTKKLRTEMQASFPNCYPQWKARAEALQIELDAMDNPPPTANYMEEFEMNRAQRNAAASATVSVNPPSPDWHLVCCKHFQSAGLIYDAGCSIKVEALGPNYQALFSGGYVRWCPPSIVARSAPRPLVVMDEKPRAAVEPVIYNVPGGDPVRDWKRSLCETAAKCNGDYKHAADVLVMNQQGADLYRRYVAVQAEINARESGQTARRIPPLM